MKTDLMETLINTLLKHRIIFTEDDYKRLVEKHKELDGYRDEIINTLKKPDEIYVDERNGYHYIREVKGISDYLVVIYILREGKGFIKTSYFINSGRKRRRYKWLRLIYSR